MFEQLIKNSLIWFPEKCYGYYPISVSCNKDYFSEYKKYDNTDTGKQITRARIDIVKKYYSGKVLDVGIGSGHFIKNHGNAYGYDVGESAIYWLIKNGLFKSLYEFKHNAITFWDSLEHIENPATAINQSNKYVFVSMPIYKDCNDVLCSKHFKKDEHYWYFTHIGIVSFFFENGFVLVEHNDIESQLGRENIGTYVFEKVQQ